MLCQCSSSSYSSTWGETLFITIQVIILLCMMFYYNRQTTLALAFPPLAAFAAWVLCSGMLSMDVLTYCQATTLPIMLLSRVSALGDRTFAFCSLWVIPPLIYLSATSTPTLPTAGVADNVNLYKWLHRSAVIHYSSDECHGYRCQGVHYPQ